MAPPLPPHNGLNDSLVSLNSVQSNASARHAGISLRSSQVTTSPLNTGGEPQKDGLETREEHYPEPLRFILDNFPKQIWAEMESLDLHDQGMEMLPYCLKDFTSLTKLNLSQNKLQRIPARFIVANIPQLEHLDLSDNHIWLLEDIQVLGGLRNLKSIDLRGNPLPFIEQRVSLVQALIVRPTGFHVPPPRGSNGSRDSHPAAVFSRSFQAHARRRHVMAQYEEIQELESSQRSALMNTSDLSVRGSATNSPLDNRTPLPPVRTQSLHTEDSIATDLHASSIATADLSAGDSDTEHGRISRQGSILSMSSHAMTDGTNASIPARTESPFEAAADSGSDIAAVPARRRTRTRSATVSSVPRNISIDSLVSNESGDGSTNGPRVDEAKLTKLFKPPDRTPKTRSPGHPSPAIRGPSPYTPSRAQAAFELDMSSGQKRSSVAKSLASVHRERARARIAQAAAETGRVSPSPTANLRARFKRGDTEAAISATDNAVKKHGIRDDLSASLGGPAELSMLLAKGPSPTLSRASRQTATTPALSASPSEQIALANTPELFVLGQRERTDSAPLNSQPAKLGSPAALKGSRSHFLKRKLQFADEVETSPLNNSALQVPIDEEEELPDNGDITTKLQRQLHVHETFGPQPGLRGFRRHSVIAPIATAQEDTPTTPDPSVYTGAEKDKTTPINLLMKHLHDIIPEEDDSLDASQDSNRVNRDLVFSDARKGVRDRVGLKARANRQDQRAARAKIGKGKGKGKKRGRGKKKGSSDQATVSEGHKMAQMIGADLGRDLFYADMSQAPKRTDGLFISLEKLNGTVLTVNDIDLAASEKPSHKEWRALNNEAHQWIRKVQSEKEAKELGDEAKQSFEFHESGRPVYSQKVLHRIKTRRIRRRHAQQVKALVNKTRNLVRFGRLDDDAMRDMEGSSSSYDSDGDERSVPAVVAPMTQEHAGMKSSQDDPDFRSINSMLVLREFPQSDPSKIIAPSMFGPSVSVREREMLRKVFGDGTNTASATGTEGKGKARKVPTIHDDAGRQLFLSHTLRERLQTEFPDANFSGVDDKFDAELYDSLFAEDDPLRALDTQTRVNTSAVLETDHESHRRQVDRFLGPDPTRTRKLDEMGVEEINTALRRKQLREFAAIEGERRGESDEGAIRRMVDQFVRLNNETTLKKVKKEHRRALDNIRYHAGLTRDEIGVSPSDPGYVDKVTAMRKEATEQLALLRKGAKLDTRLPGEAGDTDSALVMGGDDGNDDGQPNVDSLASSYQSKLASTKGMHSSKGRKPKAKTMTDDDEGRRVVRPEAKTWSEDDVPATQRFARYKLEPIDDLVRKVKVDEMDNQTIMVKCAEIAREARTVTLKDLQRAQQSFIRDELLFEEMRHNDTATLQQWLTKTQAEKTVMMGGDTIAYAEEFKDSNFVKSEKGEGLTWAQVLPIEERSTIEGRRRPRFRTVAKVARMLAANRKTGPA